jgi:hypothetical protein
MYVVGRCGLARSAMLSDRGFAAGLMFAVVASRRRRRLPMATVRTVDVISTGCNLLHRRTPLPVNYVSPHFFFAGF